MLKAACGAAALSLVLACAPSSPCRSGDKVRQLARYSKPYVGHWTIARGDTLTIPDTTMGDRFKLADIVLDTDTVSVGKECLYRGQLTFALPAETLGVTWYGVPERVTIIGWPASLGPFAGLDASWWGHDSLHGEVLYGERLGIRVQPGATAQFWAGRAPPR